MTSLPLFFERFRLNDISFRQPHEAHAGRKVVTLKLAAAASTSSVPTAFSVAHDGCSVHAAVACAWHPGALRTSTDRGRIFKLKQARRSAWQNLGRAARENRRARLCLHGVLPRHSIQPLVTDGDLQCA